MICRRVPFEILSLPDARCGGKQSDKNKTAELRGHIPHNSAAEETLR
jgi:hypothetical protein